MAIKYNIIKAFEDERAEGIATGRAEGIAAGRAEGIATGRAEERASVIIETLEELGEVPENLKITIMSQRNLDLLKEWHKEAAHVNSIEEFKSRTLRRS